MGRRGNIDPNWRCYYAKNFEKKITRKTSRDLYGRKKIFKGVLLWGYHHLFLQRFMSLDFWGCVVYLFMTDH